MRIDQPSVALIWVTPSVLQTIESAGRTAYQSELGTDPEAFVRMLIKRGHESVLEHACMSVRIVCDRGISHEIVRHRIASYTQESTRYCKYEDGIHVICPSFPDDPGQHLFNHWEESCRDAEGHYLNMLEQGLPPQIARSVLPTCLKTEIVMTANFREWRHFLKLRLASGAHPDMRIIAGMVRDVMLKLKLDVLLEDIV